MAFLEYHEKQYGRVFIGFMVFAFVVTLITILSASRSNPIPLQAWLPVTLVLGVIVLLFYKMETLVTDRQIVISFGVGLIRKKIDIDRLATVVPVKNKWYFGWGIRVIPRGMMYNIQGLYAVEVTYLDSKRITRIGSSDSERLALEIQKRIDHHLKRQS